MKKIGVVIRVYDRIEDLQNNLRIIRETWSMFEYELVVVANGKSKGFILPPDVYDRADKVIELEQNAGHLKGNSQLLLEGMKNIVISHYDYIIILESDTWLYTDKLIGKYIKLLDSSDAVWASARWYDRFYSLATDFAIIKVGFLKDNISILDFTLYPECHVCNYLMDRELKYILIKENMNVMLPGYITHFPYAPKGRFYVFLKSRMVTHHVEDILGGMEEKKYFFNLLANNRFFEIPKRLDKIERYKILIITFVDKLLFRRSWYTRRKRNVF